MMDELAVEEKLCVLWTLRNKMEIFNFRASIPKMLILLFFLILFPHSYYVVSMGMVHRVTWSLAHRGLTSSVYLITGQTGGKRDQ